MPILATVMHKQLAQAAHLEGVKILIKNRTEEVHVPHTVSPGSFSKAGNFLMLPCSSFPFVYKVLQRTGADLSDEQNQMIG